MVIYYTFIFWYFLGTLDSHRKTRVKILTVFFEIVLFIILLSNSEWKIFKTLNICKAIFFLFYILLHIVI